jgi:integrase
MLPVAASSSGFFTETTLQALEPRNKKYVKGDGRSLFVSVHPNGRRYFFFRYRFPSRRNVTPSDYQIGPHGKNPAEWSLKNARAECDRLREILRSGIDPRTTKKTASAVVAFEASSPCFEKVADDWFSSIEGRLKETTLTDYRNKLENQIKPRFGALDITGIRRSECLTFKEEIAARGAKNHSDKCFMLLRQIFEYAIDREIIDSDNPARSSRGSRSEHIAKNYPLLPWEEMPEFLSTISANNSRGNPITVASVKFVFLTAQRVGSTIPAQWNEIDWSAKTWLIPEERMKGRLGHGKEHLVPLSEAALKVLNYLKPITGSSNFIFMTVRGKSTGHISKESPNSYIKRCGYEDKMVAHSARSALLTFGQDVLKENFDVIDRHLAHKPAGKIRAAYDRSTFWDERMSLMEKWAMLLCSNGLQV